MSESIFVADGERFVPTEQARGPWDPRALHGGAPAALITSAFERMEPGSELRVGRLGFEFLRPIPMAALTLSTSIARPGRRVQELSAELRAGDELVVRASALRVQAVPGEAESAAAAARTGAQGGPAAETTSKDLPAAMPPPAEGEHKRFALNDSTDASFAGTAMEMRWLNDPWRPGPGRVWQRLRHPLLPGRKLTALTRLAATADFCNGVSATLPFDRFLFINADLTVHLQRLPQGEWIGLDALTQLHEGGAALAEGVLHDERGPIGRAFQTLVVQQR
ncbi:MAG TPA: thioesterase family protein [Solirubrobacteraceae bacterium]|nr:thioesterase family protein [Solirubrobacteraceae bacterium]